jgi:hypothetical protein
MNSTNVYRTQALRWMAESGLLDRDDPEALRLRALVLQNVAHLDSLLRRIGWRGRLRLRIFSARIDLLGRLRGWSDAKYCTHWPTRHVDRCPVERWG